MKRTEDRTGKSEVRAQKRAFGRGRSSMAVLMLLWGLSILLSGCGGTTAVRDEGPFDAEKSMAKAEKLLQESEYTEARRVLTEVKNRDASRKYAPQAQLKIADSHVQEGDPEVGIAEYQRFIEMYPDSQYASHAQYQIAMAYFTQIESPDRGSGAAEKALKEFLLLKERYPRNPYREVLELRIEKCRNVIADGEFMVGRFYYNKEAYQAALNRWEGLLRNFPAYKRADETLLLIGKTYRELKEEDKAREAFETLVRKFPSSPFAEEAKKEL